MAKTGYFFDDESDLKAYLPVSASLSISDLRQQFETVTDNYIRPKIGVLVDAILADYQSETDNGLIKYTQKAIANFALYHQLPIMQVQIGDSGVSRYESDNEKSAYKYQIDQVREEILNTGFAAIESLLAFLEANPDDYETYIESQERIENTKNLIWNSTEFNKYQRLSFAASTFDGLAPTLQAVEDFIITSYIGDKYYEELQNERRSTMTADNKVALVLIQKAIAYFVIEFFSKSGSGKATRDGFKIINIANENTSTSSAAIDQIRLTTNYSKMAAYMYISKLQRLLATEDKYSTYKDFLLDNASTTTFENTGAIYRF